MAVRGMYVGGLIRLRPDWYLGSLQSSSLGELRLIAHEPFREIAPSLRLDDFVRALDAGRETPGDRFAQRYRQLRPTFDPAKVRGRPMLAGKALAGPFIEIDGLTRVSILWSRHLKNDSLPQRIEVVAGISPRIEEWPYACADGHVPVEWASPARY
ncbi:MAG TPA: hypothetical protein VML94_02200 [Thermoplasmata archaeon]|nr:hypothetical protein [Thermoplasmata archaeon]